MTHKKGLSLCCLCFAITTPVYADNFDLSGHVGFVSEYSFRGISQSDEHPALQGGFDISHPYTGLYAGLWGSNVDFGDADLEVDAYIGFSKNFKGLNYDLGAIYYTYPGANDSLDYDYAELSAAIGYDFDLFATSASLNYSPEFFGSSGHAAYYAANIEVPLPQDISLSGHLGWQNIEDNRSFGVPDYMDWSLGLGYNYEGFDLSATYIDTDLSGSECADGCDAKLILGVSRGF